MSLKIPLSYTPIDPNTLTEVLDKFAGQSHENIIVEFQRRLQDFTKSKHVVALSSGTAAIHLALKAIGVESGDEVLVSAFTYVGTVNPILYLGAKPVFIDVDETSWNMDTALLEMAIKDRRTKGVQPKAILVVHNYGMPARMEEIMKLANQYEIPVVEDAAEALGSKIVNRHVGTFGKVGILSFNNNKILTTYGGGAILTDDPELAGKISFWSGQSRENKRYYEHKELGYNYKMGPLNAAVGLSKVEALNDEVQQRRKVHDAYGVLLTHMGFEFQKEPTWAFSNRWLTTVVVNKIEGDMDVLMQNIDNQGVETRRVWNPMNRQPLFKSCEYFTIDNVSDRLFAHAFCLPFSLTAEKTVVPAIIKSMGYN